MRTIIISLFIAANSLFIFAQRYGFCLCELDSTDTWIYDQEELDKGYFYVDSLFKIFISRLYSEYEKECLNDTMKVCRFRCYYSPEFFASENKSWAEFDCYYYNTYKNIYYCGEKFYKWVPKREPAPADFIKWLTK